MRYEGIDGRVAIGDGRGPMGRRSDGQSTGPGLAPESS